MSPYKPKRYQVAEFKLFGKKTPDGKIKVGFNHATAETMNEFPEEVAIMESIYTLERVEERGEHLYGVYM